LAKFPEPPPATELAKIPPAVRVLPAGTALFRLYFRGGKHPGFWNTFRSFGPLESRFDHQLPPRREQGRGILYAAENLPTCLAEVFQERRLIDRKTREPWLAGFELSSELVLLDLTGRWPTRAGASMAINSGPRLRAQRWSREIYAAYPEIQGLYYPSSMYGEGHCLALYEKAGTSIPGLPVLHRPLNHPGLLLLLGRTAEDIGYDIV
jgi:hypothetical protein